MYVYDDFDWAFLKAVDRPPTLAERHILENLYDKTLSEFRRSPESASGLIHEGEAPAPGDMKPAELAAMTTVARALLNMHETITRN